MKRQPIFDQFNNNLVGHQSALLRSLSRLDPERRSQIAFAPEDGARRSNRNPKMPRNHLRLCSFSGTRRAEKHNATLHLASVKKNCHTTDHEDCDADVKPHQSSLLCRLSPIVGGAIKCPATDSPFAQKPVVMTLNQMCLDLSHCIKNHTDDNEQTGPAKKLRRDCGTCRPWLRRLGKMAISVRKIAPAKVSRVIVKSRKSAVGFPGRTPGI